jgi:hypothetical protein
MGFGILLPDAPLEIDPHSRSTPWWLIDPHSVSTQVVRNVDQTGCRFVDTMVSRCKCLTEQYAPIPEDWRELGNLPVRPSVDTVVGQMQLI